MSASSLQLSSNWVNEASKMKSGDANLFRSFAMLRSQSVELNTLVGDSGGEDVGPLRYEITTTHPQPRLGESMYNS